MTKSPPIGAIIRIHDQVGPSPLAVVIPCDRARNYSSVHARHLFFVMPLERWLYNSNSSINGGWWLSKNRKHYRAIPDDEVPEHILALAARVLLDPSFVPFVTEA